MSYNYQIERKALKFIQKQPEDQQRRIYAQSTSCPMPGIEKNCKGIKGYIVCVLGPTASSIPWIVGN